MRSLPLLALALAFLIPLACTRADGSDPEGTGAQNPVATTGPWVADPVSVSEDQKSVFLGHGYRVYSYYHKGTVSLEGKTIVIHGAHEFGFWVANDNRKANLVDFWPQVRDANRYSYEFQLPKEATDKRGERVALDEKHPEQFAEKIFGTKSLDTGTYDATPGRTKNRPEECNAHFYHALTPHWPDSWPDVRVDYVGDGWWRFTCNNEPYAQRDGHVQRAGIYEPMQDQGWPYIGYWTRWYSKLGNAHATAGWDRQWGKDAVFRVRDIRIWHAPETVRLTAEGKHPLRLVLEADARILKVDFEIENLTGQERTYLLGFSKGIHDKVPQLGKEKVTLGPHEKKSMPYRRDLRRIKPDVVQFCAVHAREVGSLAGSSVMIVYVKTDKQVAAATLTPGEKVK